LLVLLILIARTPHFGGSGGIGFYCNGVVFGVLLSGRLIVPRAADSCVHCVDVVAHRGLVHRVWSPAILVVGAAFESSVLNSTDFGSRIGESYLCVDRCRLL